MLSAQNVKTRAKRLERMRAARLRGSHSVTDWLGLRDEFTADDGRFLCVMCGELFRQITKDHVRPIYQGGCDCIHNLQPVCVRCNARKGPDNTNWRDMRRLADALL